jgi:hypothetical protein
VQSKNEMNIKNIKMFLTIEEIIEFSLAEEAVILLKAPCPPKSSIQPWSKNFKYERPIKRDFAGK